MSFIDKVAAAVAPPATPAARLLARSRVRLAAGRGGWLASVLDHHEEIEAGFVAVREADDPRMQAHCFRKLSALITAHCIAEEVALYPALAGAEEKDHAMKAYSEQSSHKILLGLLQDVPPMTQDFLKQLDQLEEAVAHHIYEEESLWLLELMSKTSTADQVKLTLRYQAQFSRYLDEDPGRRDSQAASDP